MYIHLTNLIQCESGHLSYSSLDLIDSTIVYWEGDIIKLGLYDDALDYCLSEYGTDTTCICVRYSM